MSGTLYIVATPIGNLEDITYRAVRVLRECALIACEDTRQTRKLLDHYGISKPMISYHDHNERTRSEDLIEALASGSDVAIVSDAGTPLIADPGYRVVAAARERGFAVVPAPGPSALLAALSASGLPADSFAFLGFLPAKAGQRRKALEEAKGLNMTVVWYETPHRIGEALADVAAVFGDTPVVAARELTKIHEEFLRGTAAEVRDTLAKRDTAKGEFTLVIARPETVPDQSVPIEHEVEELIRRGMPRMEALKYVARRRGLSKREVYREVEGR